MVQDLTILSESLKRTIEASSVDLVQSPSMQGMVLHLSFSLPRLEFGKEQRVLQQMADTLAALKEATSFFTDQEVHVELAVAKKEIENKERQIAELRRYKDAVELMQGRGIK